MGLTLTFLDRTHIKLRKPTGSTIAYNVLKLFPFTSKSKRMGIVVRDTASGELSFLQKGADVVMAHIVQCNDWLEEEMANMARKGLHTLVVAQRRLSEPLTKISRRATTPRACALKAVMKPWRLSLQTLLNVTSSYSG